MGQDELTDLILKCQPLHLNQTPTMSVTEINRLLYLLDIRTITVQKGRN